jgi:WD40 repeat protein
LPSNGNGPGLIVTLGEAIYPPRHGGIPAFSPDGRIIALASSKISFWNVETHQLVREIKYPDAADCCIVHANFSPDGKFFAASMINRQDGKNVLGHLMVWEMETGNLLQDWDQEYAKMPGPGGADYSIPVHAFAFIPGTTNIVFATGNTLETRDIFQNEKFDVLKLGSKMYATQISLSSDSRLVYIIMSWEKDHDWPSNWTHQHKFQVWNIKSHAMLREVKYPEGWVNLSLRLLGTHLVQVDIENSKSQITNLETDEVKDIPYRQGWRFYNADGSLMIYARIFGFDANEQGIELWKTDNWKNIYKFALDTGVDEIIFNPDSTILAIANNEQVSLWNIAPFVQP